MPKSSKDDIPNRTGLDEFVRGARKAAALKTALELELFTRIAEGHHSLPALLRATGLNERGGRLLLDALVNINLLVKSAFEYALTPTADTFLVKGKPTYYGDALLTQLAWDARGQLTRAARSGRPTSGFATDGASKLYAAKAAATWVDWASIVQEFAGVWEQLSVSESEESGLKALAFGAEAGLRLLSLAQRDPRTRIVVVDNAPALVPLSAILETVEVKNQIEFLDGDWLAVELPTEAFDLAFVDSITVYRSLEQNIGILHRAYEALVWGGRVVLRALVAEDDRKGPGLIPLAGLDLLMATVDGDIYTTTEYRGMLEAAGFFEVKLVSGLDGMLTARRTQPPPPLPPAATIAPDFIPPPETLD